MNLFSRHRGGTTGVRANRACAITAIEVELHRSRLYRLSGKTGHVGVWAKDGRKISAGRLDNLVWAEKAKIVAAFDSDR
jgi:hypothetical protein